MDVRAQWTGEVFHPSRRPEGLEQGETVVLEVHRPRSMKSHRHQFAEVRAAWASLPEQFHDQPWAKDFNTLRKRALCATGWCDMQEWDLGSADAAMMFALMAKSEGYATHGYCEVGIDAAKGKVRRTTPKSQKRALMGAKNFQRSKSDVLDWCAALVGSTREALAEAARTAA